MGQSFDYGGPVTDKESENGWANDLRLAWGASCMQGWRDGMEDAHLAEASLGEWSSFHNVSMSSASSLGGWSNTATFAVFDGHGGENVALFCKRHMPAEIAAGPHDNVPSALVDAFHKMDDMLRDPTHLSELRSLVNGISPQAALRSLSVTPLNVGCTAIVTCVRSDSIVVANAGDSRAVMCRAGRAVELSEDHKPNLLVERERIAKAGGFVEEQRIGPITQYRVNGNLNLSRSIGDLSYKRNRDLADEEQMICATPDVRTFGRTDHDEFMVLACDGVWDVMSSQEVVDYIRCNLGNVADLEDRLRTGELRLSTVLEGLLDTCISPNLQQTFGLGGDNMTAVLVVFLPSPIGPHGQILSMPWSGPVTPRTDSGSWVGRSQGGQGAAAMWLCPHC